MPFVGWRLGPRKFGRTLAAVLAVAQIAVNVRAEMPQPEAKLKAMFLYNFALFTEWTVPANAALTFCVLGDARLGRELELTVRGKTVVDRAIAVRPSATAGELENCQLVYLGKGERNRSPQILRGLRGRGTLSVSEFPESGREGAVVNFYSEQNKIRFAVNLQAAAGAGVSLRSNLLRLARITE